MRYLSLIGFLLTIHSLETLPPQRTQDQVRANPLALRLSHGPLVLKNVPLTRALGEVGFQIEHGYVLFGVEVKLNGGKEPTVSLNLDRSSSLESALEQVLSQVQGYEYKVEGEHLINVFPKDAWSDSQDLLNTPVEKFAVFDQPPSFLLATPQSYIPALRGRLTPAGQPSGTAGSVMSQVGEPGVTLELRNVTVREILNAVAQATEGFPPKYFPLGWAYLFEPPSTPSLEAKHSWRALSSAPRNWKNSAGNSSAHYRGWGQVSLGGPM